jgi:hypothetical protein
MSPPISKDWWLAAALTGASLPAALAQQPPGPAGRQAGIVTTVTKGTAGTTAPLYIESASGQRVVTGPNETKHVLFSDQSALTVGPNSDIVIADYRYDTQAKSGNLLVDMTKGVLRVVGGFISKREETRVRTATATIGIRGGISIIESDDQDTTGTFLFGQRMNMSDNAGNNESVSRPGFGSGVGRNGPPRPPSRMDPAQLARLLQQLGNPVPPAMPPGPPPPPPPAQGRNPVHVNVGPDRVGGQQGEPGQGVVPPTLSDVLGNQSPGNQS